MSKEIEGTEDYGEGAMVIPTGVDFGGGFSSILNTILTRLALHDHSSDGAPAALPKSIYQDFLNAALTFTADGVLYQTDLEFTDGLKVTSKNLDFYYKDSSDPDTIVYWKKCYPEYGVVDDTNITLRKLPLNTIDIKVIS